MLCAVLVVRDMSFFDLPVSSSGVIPKSVDTEETDHLLQGFGLRREFFSSAGKLLRARGVALGHQANLVDGTVDLAHPCSLFTFCALS